MVEKHPAADEALPPSKSQLKREARDKFDLGRSLVDLPEGVLRSLPMDDSLLQALLEARAIRAHVARKRQLGFVARLLRKADTGALLAALEERQSAARSLTVRQHRAEAWRDLLLEAGDGPLAVLVAGRDDVDVPALRQLVRNARAEQARGKPPASARKLFRMLRELDERQALPPTG